MAGGVDLTAGAVGAIDFLWPALSTLNTEQLPSSGGMLPSGAEPGSRHREGLAQ